MPVQNERVRCVRCNSVAEDGALRCEHCSSIAFYRGRPLTWWPLRYHTGETQFLFPKMPEAPSNVVGQWADLNGPEFGRKPTGSLGSGSRHSVGRRMF